MRVTRKAREQGIEALTDEERAIYEAGREQARKIWAQLPQSTIDKLKESAALAARVGPKFEQLSPADQMRYGDWTLQHLEVFLPLIAPELSEEPNQDQS